MASKIRRKALKIISSNWWSYDIEVFAFHPTLLKELNNIGRAYIRHNSFIAVASKYDEYYYKLFQSVPLSALEAPVVSIPIKKTNSSERIFWICGYIVKGNLNTCTSLDEPNEYEELKKNKISICDTIVPGLSIFINELDSVLASTLR